MNVKAQGRTAYSGSVRGSIVEFGHVGVRMRLRGTGEVVFLMYQHLDPIGFKPVATQAKAVPTKAKPKVRKASKPAKAKREVGVREHTVSDLVRHKGSLESIGKATVNK